MPKTETIMQKFRNYLPLFVQVNNLLFIYTYLRFLYRFGFNIQSFMKKSVFRVRHYLKIFYSIISLISIYMMYKFIMFKKSAKFLFHYKTMFPNIFVSQRMRVCRIKQQNITIRVNISSTFPFGVFFSFKKFTRSNIFRLAIHGTKRASVPATFTLFSIITSLFLKILMTVKTFKSKILNMWVLSIEELNFSGNNLSHI